MPNFFNNLRRRMRNSKRRQSEINPEDIFLDSANTLGLNRDRFEGRMEKPIGSRTFLMVKVAMILVAIFLGSKLFSLQVVKGESYSTISEANRLDRTVIFADRGVIYDRKDVPLAQNAVKPDEGDFAAREYARLSGIGTVVGYIKYPSKDKSGRYYDESYHGIAGVEKVYDAILSGQNGSKLTESDALGKVTSESVLDAPKNGADLRLSLDSALTAKMYDVISATARERGFTGGAGVIMDVETGEIIALASFPDYDPNLFVSGTNSSEIAGLLKDRRTPLLNRAVSGLYTPGSIVKPIVALGALSEGVITPEKTIVSTGKLVVPNPYDPAHPSIFKDWKAHGAVNMREAISVSSDVYFYEVGGGFGSQKGLGIGNLDKYFSLFGLNEETGIDLPAEAQGVIATPEWKAEHFPDDPDWRIGNTYITAIGQYGTQVTPLAVVRYIGAIANKGTLLNPSVILGGKSPEERVYRHIDLPEADWRVVHEGMRGSVTHGTAAGLSNPNVAIAGKTGTAELGARKEFVNSWTVGFFPYEHPRYAFALIMEKGPVGNLVGATAVFRQVLDWMAVNAPEYFK